MLLRNSLTTIALATALLAGAGARADDASKYPNWKGQWVGVGAAADAAWDPGKPGGIAAELSNGRGHALRIIRISGKTAPGFDDDARRVT